MKSKIAMGVAILVLMVVLSFFISQLDAFTIKNTEMKDTSCWCGYDKKAKYFSPDEIQMDDGKTYEVIEGVAHYNCFDKYPLLGPYFADKKTYTIPRIFNGVNNWYEEMICNQCFKLCSK